MQNRYHNANVSDSSVGQIQQQNEQIIEAQRDFSKGANLSDSRTLTQNGLSLQNILELFEQFKNSDSNMIKASDFLNRLKGSGVSNTCSLLVNKLVKLNDKMLSDREFIDLFNFDFVSFPENLELILAKIQQLAGNNPNISIQDLTKINTQYNAGLSQQDIDILIKYGGNQGDFISLEQLRSLISGQ